MRGILLFFRTRFYKLRIELLMLYETESTVSFVHNCVRFSGRLSLHLPLAGRRLDLFFWGKFGRNVWHNYISVIIEN